MLLSNVHVNWHVTAVSMISHMVVKPKDVSMTIAFLTLSPFLIFLRNDLKRDALAFVLPGGPPRSAVWFVSAAKAVSLILKS